MEALFTTLANLPPLLTYLVLGIGAALENVFPPIPADTFVLFGAFLAAQGRANPWGVWLVTWLANAASALAIYMAAWHYGRKVFRTAVGRWVLHPGQLERLARFYHGWGTTAIFFSRFIPGFRAVVPIFAGISRLRPRRVALPIVVASGIWYGAIVLAGSAAGANWTAIRHAFRHTGVALGGIGVLLAAIVGVWWWRTRHPRP